MAPPREVLLVGSVPLRPAAKVFETVAAHLGALAPRIPDGEMMGWLREVWASHARNPGLEPAGKLKGQVAHIRRERSMADEIHPP